MENPITFSQLNDFIFCPASIFFHNFYNERDKISYQSISQIAGTNAHKTVDTATYSTKKTILQGIEVYSDKYGLVGKIDLFNIDTGMLTERKKKIQMIYDGYIFQLYAQYFAMREMGYNVVSLQLQSMDDNKFYSVLLPHQDLDMFRKFEDVIISMQTISIGDFHQTNTKKCSNCIYEPACDRSLL